MDAAEFREFGKAAVDFIADYYETIRDRPVLPSVRQGYLGDLLPENAPENGESWRDVLQDVDRIIMPGMTHWQSPNFHGFFPSGQSFPSVVAEMISAAFSVIGLSWIASPAVTELEVIMMNWLGKMLELPEHFMNSSESNGGGVIQTSASEATYVSLLAAKEKKVKELRTKIPYLTEAEIKGKLIAYSSNQSNSSVEKAGLLGSMKMRLLPTNEQGELTAATLQNAINKDKEDGLIPCYFVANLGTTATCAFDNLEELGPICNKEEVWLHVDAAYAGTAFICPEYRHLLNGVEMVDSFNFNPHKWMLVNFDCSAMWIRDAKYLVEAFNVDRVYLKDQHKGLAPEYRHWQISLGRRFRALKLWFVLRIYGVEGIKKHVRDHVGLANYFSTLVKSDERFELSSCSMGLASFRLKGDDALTERLLNKIMDKKNQYLIACHLNQRFVIRYAICSRSTEQRDVDYSWKEIVEAADELVPRANKKLIVEKQASLKIDTSIVENNVEKTK